jgi:hypothetical protein
MKKKTIDDFVKIKLVTVQDDADSIEEGAKIYGYSIETVGNMVKNHNIHLIPDNKGINTRMVQNYWSDFMKYTGFSVEDVLDFIEINVVNNPKKINLSLFNKK